VSYLVRDDVSLGEITGSVVASFEFLEEGYVDIDRLVAGQ